MIEGFVVLLIAALVLGVLVVPVALLLLLLVAMLVAAAVATVLALITGAVALAFSPLLVVVALLWLVWRLIRGGNRRAITPGATMTP